MGVVYQAHDQVRGDVVALKTLRRPESRLAHATAHSARQRRRRSMLREYGELIVRRPGGHHAHDPIEPLSSLVVHTSCGPMIIAPLAEEDTISHRMHWPPAPPRLSPLAGTKMGVMLTADPPFSGQRQLFGLTVTRHDGRR